jgi:hypothetical protein
VPVFPNVSVELQLTTVVPIGNSEPDSGEHVTGAAASSGSLAVTSNATSTPGGIVASTVVESGTVRTGGVVSGGPHSNAPISQAAPCGRGMPR